MPSYEGVGYDPTEERNFRPKKRVLKHQLYFPGQFSATVSRNISVNVGLYTQHVAVNCCLSPHFGSEILISP